MADLKIQAAQGTYHGADFRGDKRLGKDTDPVDRHATLGEVRIPDELADECIAEADVINQAIDSFMSKWKVPFVDKVAGLLLGGEGQPFIAARVYDND